MLHKKIILSIFQFFRLQTLQHMNYIYSHNTLLGLWSLFCDLKPNVYFLLDVAWCLFHLRQDHGQGLGQRAWESDLHTGYRKETISKMDTSMQLAVLPPFQRELIPLEIHVHEQRGINTLGNYSKTQYDLE